MIKINLTNEKIEDIKSDLEIILVLNKDLKQKNIQDTELLKSLNFKANDDETALLLENKRLYVGCEEVSYESIAIALSNVIKKVQTTTLLNIKMKLFSDEKEVIKPIVEGLYMGAYSFSKYKSEKKKAKKITCTLSCEENVSDLDKFVKESIIISQSVNKVRDFVNTIPEDFYPNVMAKEAKKIAKETEIKCKVLGEEYLEKKKMNAMLSVGRASVHESKLIHLSYTPDNAKKKIVLVGKGLTYDSGGLSLKPADFMVTMKSDKSGGCAVLGILNAVALLKLPIEVHGIVGAVENMIGGDAYKPDDVLIAKNGTSIEVRNTDAEGRLVLADCLCYAQDKIKDIDYLFDFATLTGAAVVGVGEYTTAIMGNESTLKCKAVKSALNSGEYATSLPFNKFLKKTIKSEIADICNIANTRYGGAITAGLFLEHFIEDKYKTKWLHFDIAGPAFVEKPWGYNPHGASGAGVRMAIEFIKNEAKK